MILVLIYGSLVLITGGYAVLLERLHDLYTPDWVWLTVVGGNTLIGLALLALCLSGELPMAAFWHLLGLNIAAGCVVITWQLLQVRWRREERDT